MLDNHCIHCNEQIVEGDDEPLSSYDFVYLPIDFLYVVIQTKHSKNHKNEMGLFGFCLMLRFVLSFSLNDAGTSAMSDMGS